MNTNLALRPNAATATTGTQKREVTAAELREILSQIFYSSDQVKAVAALGPDISDKAGASKVIVECIWYSDSKAEAIAALNGQGDPPRVAIANPTLGDRAAGLASGLTISPREFVSVAILAVIGALAFSWLGVPLQQIPVLNFVGKMAGITGFGGNFLAAFTGTAVLSSLAGAVSGFTEPTRAGANAAIAGANVGSEK